MSDAGPAGNPFVGPRPFERGARLFGRDRELRMLELEDQIGRFKAGQREVA